MENRIVISGKQLPLLISIPHSGLKVPAELKKFCRLNLPDILRDGDTWAGQLFDLRENVLAFSQFAVARAIVDPNRAADNRPPQNPDGVVKTVTVDGEPVWTMPGGLAVEQVEFLLHEYYYPYHQFLAAVSQNHKILLGLDCHTMLELAPQSSPRPLEKRPLVCLSNRGDENGEKLDELLSAPPDLLRALGKALEQRLQNIERDRSVPVVSLNRPFRGGYVVRKNRDLGLIPWIQVEFNRSLYLSSDPRTEIPDKETARRLNNLRSLFLSVLEELFHS
jgi:N-formylglutamate deformylase